MCAWCQNINAQFMIVKISRVQVIRSKTLVDLLFTRARERLEGLTGDRMVRTSQRRFTKPIVDIDESHVHNVKGILSKEC